MNSSENLLTFPTNTINIISLNIETSPEIQDKVSHIIEDLKSFFEEASANGVSLSVSINTFYKIYKATPFRGVEELNFDYPFYNKKCTALYKSFIHGTENLLDYIEQVKQATGITPHATYITLTSGNNYIECEEKEKSKESLQKLKLTNINHIYIDFNFFLFIDDSDCFDV